MSRAHDASIIRALNPADYFTLAMDEEIRKDGMPGSLCAVALQLEGCLDIPKLSRRIDDFFKSFPTARASLGKKGSRFYWLEREEARELFFVHDGFTRTTDSHELHEAIRHIMNRRDSRENVNPLEFHLLRTSSDTVLLIRWLHPFCDALGAGLILDYLASNNLPSPTESIREAHSLLNERLSRFGLWNKVFLLWKAKKLIEQLDQSKSILPTRSQSKPRTLNFRVFRIGAEQSQAIAQRSRRSVGLIASSLYTMACLMRALEGMPDVADGDAYCVPYAFNLRMQKAKSPVTGNHVCALFAQAPREIVRDRELLFRHLTEQYRLAVKQQLDYAFIPLMWLAQFLSLDRYGKSLRLSYNGGHERSSFWFSDLGQVDLGGKEIFGASIREVFHLSQVTTPPGFALLTCVCSNRLTLTYNFVEPLFDNEWVESLHERLVAELLGESA